MQCFYSRYMKGMLLALQEVTFRDTDKFCLHRLTPGVSRREKGRVHTKVLHGDAPPQGPNPYPFYIPLLTKKVEDILYLVY